MQKHYGLQRHMPMSCNLMFFNNYSGRFVRNFYYIILAIATILVSCEIRIKPNEDTNGEEQCVGVQRYDRLQSRYLTTGDFSALQQMNIDYPMETRTLVEDVLKLGEVNDPEINSKFLNFYQDTILQSLIADVELQYSCIDDINAQFKSAFMRLASMLPDLKMPTIYTQIGALDQSIVIGDNAIGISLDKYLGADYPLYRKYYTPSQRRMMTRAYIVPDALCFYILSHYPLKDYESSTQAERDAHMGKIMWVVNKAMGRQVFKAKYAAEADRYMRSHASVKVSQLLTSKLYQ